MKKQLKNLTTIREFLAYDPVTGIFTWIKQPCDGVAVGSRAGSLTNEGYRRIKFGSKEYRAARLAWFFAHGEMPSPRLEIDHKNLVRDDDRMDNLRPATRGQNSCNTGPIKRSGRSSVYKGVTWNKAVSKWQATITARGRTIYLGLFNEERDAARAYDTAAPKHFGEFARTNGLAA